jgi:cell cycle checkpoint control protein RAD9A
VLGIVKTHRLVLLTPNSLMAPGVPDALNESHLAIGPKAMKDMLDQFPSTRGTKSDPQLIWEFGNEDVKVKSCEASMDKSGIFLKSLDYTEGVTSQRLGNVQLSTELTISSDEFEDYTVFSTPVSLAFHLREFSVSDPLHSAPPI